MKWIIDQMMNTSRSKKNLGITHDGIFAELTPKFEKKNRKLFNRKL